MDRDSMEYDVVIVGGGPAGLSAAIRLKQLASEGGNDISVCVLEKGSEVGAHILSGAILDPVALNELIPDWKEKGAPKGVEVSRNQHWVLSEKGRSVLPHFLLPPLITNKGCFTLSLGNLCRWLASEAEALGVEIYAGFAAAEVLFDDDGAVRGVATGDMGVAQDGAEKDNYTRGIELLARHTFFAEGCRGSLSKQVIAKFDLDQNCQPQTYAIGLKELWDAPEGVHSPGFVVHTQGWPLSDTVGGGFVYHQENGQIAIGFVVALDYENPYLSPYEEFQRFKSHPDIRKFLEGGRRVAYGARAINEGGFQSIPKLAFPGGALIGCSAGFVNVPRIKGVHNAMRTGMLAADAAAAALREGEAASNVLTGYEEAFRASSVYRELKKVRNARPSLSRFGIALGTIYSGIDLWLNSLGLGFLFPWTFEHHKDHEMTRRAAGQTPIDYPKPDGVVSFDKPSSVFLSNTDHEEDQPVHLQLIDPDLPITYNLAEFDAPEQRYCPAGVYEIVYDDQGNDPQLQINAQNCVHCKTCDIKDMNQNILWVVPEGGSGPNYPNM